jgi:hypothetical protein
MSRYFVVLMLLVNCLSACTSLTATPLVIKTIEAPDSVTSTLSALQPQKTNTLHPNQTVRISSTPDYLLTPTANPTIDVKKVKTAQPIPKGQCPVPKPALLILKNTFTENDDYSVIGEKVIEQLNNGVMPDILMKEIERVFHGNVSIKKIDLTGDGLQELVVYVSFRMIIMGCIQGNYQTFLIYPEPEEMVWGGGPKALAIKDINLDGVPELVLSYSKSTGENTVVDILAWDGALFKSIIQVSRGEDSEETSALTRNLAWYPSSRVGEKPMMNCSADVQLQDLDKNGTQELILTDYGPCQPDSLYDFGPWRGQQMMFKWDGQHYLYMSQKLTPPIYRFQAVQDADRAFLMGENDQALKLYQEVIFNDKLEWWSHERREFIRDSKSSHPTLALPKSDPNEYQVLSAYARYRIVLHHLNKGWESDASMVYKTLLNKYPLGNKGAIYVEMAGLLIKEYQASKDLKKACKQVLEYTTAHPEVIEQLNENDYGAQSHHYQLEEICPVK